jgi:hypothetical protein
MKKYIVMASMLVAVLMSSCTESSKVKSLAVDAIKEELLVPSSLKVLEFEYESAHVDEHRGVYTYKAVITSKNVFGVDVKKEMRGVVVPKEKYSSAISYE